MRASSLVTVGLVAGTFVFPLALTDAALADPSGDTFTLVCNGTSYQVATPPGNGDFTPALDLGSNRVFIPHAFGAFTGTIRDASGAVVDSFTEPAGAQGSGKQKNDVSCSFTFHEVSDGSEPDFPAGYTFDGSGTVTGQISH